MTEAAGDNLRNPLEGGKQNDKKAIAEGAAISVVIVLLIAWGVYFIHKIQNGSQELNLSAGAQDEFNFTNVKDAQDQLQNSYRNVNNELRELRDQSLNSGSDTQQQTVQQYQNTDSTIFENSAPSH